MNSQIKEPLGLLHALVNHNGGVAFISSESAEGMEQCGFVVRTVNDVTRAWTTRAWKESIEYRQEQMERAAKARMEILSVETRKNSVLFNRIAKVLGDIGAKHVCEILKGKNADDVERTLEVMGIK